MFKFCFLAKFLESVCRVFFCYTKIGNELSQPAKDVADSVVYVSESMTLTCSTGGNECEVRSDISL